MMTTLILCLSCALIGYVIGINLGMAAGVKIGKDVKPDYDEVYERAQRLVKEATLILKRYHPDEWS